MTGDDTAATDLEVIGRLVDELDWTNWSPAPDTAIGETVIEIGDQEVHLALVDRHGLHVCDSIDRGRRSTLGAFDAPRDARRFLVMLLAAELRNVRRLSSLRPAGPAPGTDLEVGPTEHRLTWPDGLATFGGATVGQTNARIFSWVALATPEAIAASYADPAGGPLFAAAG